MSITVATLAARLHVGQVDKHGAPYLDYLTAVVAILRERWPDAPEWAVEAVAALFSPANGQLWPDLQRVTRQLMREGQVRVAWGCTVAHHRPAPRLPADG